MGAPEVEDAAAGREVIVLKWISPKIKFASAFPRARWSDHSSARVRYRRNVKNPAQAELERGNLGSSAWAGPTPRHPSNGWASPVADTLCLRGARRCLTAKFGTSTERARMETFWLRQRRPSSIPIGLRRNQELFGYGGRSTSAFVLQKKGCPVPLGEKIGISTGPPSDPAKVLKCLGAFPANP